MTKINYDRPRLRASRGASATYARPQERVSVPQRSTIRQLERQLGLPPRDLYGMSMAEASEVIDALLRALRG